MGKKAPPHAVMLNLIIGYWVSRLVYVAAKLKLADLLRDGPRTADELAAAWKSLCTIRSVNYRSLCSPTDSAEVPKKWKYPHLTSTHAR